MQSIAQEFKEQALSPSRHVSAAISVQSWDGSGWTDPRIYSGSDSIMSLATDIGKSSGGLVIGATYSGKLTVQLSSAAVIRDTDRIRVRIDFLEDNGTTAASEYLGYYYVDSIRRQSGGLITVTAYDRMLRGAKLYDPSELTFPCAALDVVQDICSRMSLTLHPDFSTRYDPQIADAPVKSTAEDGSPVYYTRRELLGYIAMMYGGSWFVDTDNHLTLTRFTAVDEPALAENSMTADIDATPFTVKGISWNLNGISYSRLDSDAYGVIEFTNPLEIDRREPVMGNIEDKLIGLTYHNATIERQGCGWYELGDIVTAYTEDGSSYPVLITGIRRELRDGAYTERLYSSALSDAESNYTSGDIEGQRVPQSVAAVEGVVSGSIAPLSEYEYLSDVAVKLNGITYTAAKNEAGLISKISDSYGKELIPTTSSDITDVAFHNAVLMAAATIMGLGSVAERLLFSGINGAWEFKGGLTGFTAVKAENQSYSGITDNRYLPDGSHPISLTKSYGINDSYDNYTDAVVMHSNEKINLTAYSKLRVRAMVFSDYSGGVFTGLYFRAGGIAEAAERGVPYDYSMWERLEYTTAHSSYDNPPSALDKWYDVDISGATGEHYLNFGVYHGTAVNGYTAYCYIKQIILIP